MAAPALRDELPGEPWWYRTGRRGAVAGLSYCFRLEAPIGLSADLRSIGLGIYPRRRRCAAASLRDVSARRHGQLARSGRARATSAGWSRFRGRRRRVDREPPRDRVRLRRLRARLEALLKVFRRKP